MSPMWIILKKELKDALRDRRSVFAALSYSIGTPILMALVFLAMIDKYSSPEALYINVEGGEQAQELLGFLASKDIRQGDAENKAEDILLKIENDFGRDFSSGRGATVSVVVDLSEQRLQASVARLQENLLAYSQEIAAIRLLARGVAPEVIRPLDIQVQNQANAESRAAFLVGICVFIMIYAVFISGMNLSIDTSAGERERNSLALMLSLPIKVSDLVLAKVLAVSCFAMMGLVLINISFLVAFQFMPWHEMGLNVEFSPQFQMLMMILSLPIALMAASLQLFVSFMAKTFKEAQSYLTLVLMAPMGLAMAAGYDIGPDLLEWLPVSGQQKALMEFVKGHDLPIPQLLMSSTITAAIAAMLVMAMVMMLKREKTIFAL